MIECRYYKFCKKYKTSTDALCPVCDAPWKVVPLEKILREAHSYRPKQTQHRKLIIK